MKNLISDPSLILRVVRHLPRVSKTIPLPRHCPRRERASQPATTSAVAQEPHVVPLISRVTVSSLASALGEKTSPLVSTTKAANNALRCISHPHADYITSRFWQPANYSRAVRSFFNAFILLINGSVDQFLWISEQFGSSHYIVKGLKEREPGGQKFGRCRSEPRSYIFSPSRRGLEASGSPLAIRHPRSFDRTRRAPQSIFRDPVVEVRAKT